MSLTILPVYYVQHIVEGAMEELFNFLGFKKAVGTNIYIHRYLPEAFILVLGRIKYLNLNKGQYFSVFDPISKRGYVFHRLRALAFLKPLEGIPLDQQVVNHLNGKKHDNQLDNLEWTTHQGNSEHTARTGLNPTCIPGTCKDLVTGNVFDFYSLWDLSREIGYHAGMIQKYISFKKDYPFKNRYQINTQGNEQTTFTNNDLWKSGPGSPTPVIVTNNITGEVKIFGTFCNMVRKLGKKWIHKKKLLPWKPLKFDEYTVVIASKYEDIMAGHKENEEYAKECYRGIINSFPLPHKVSCVDKSGNVTIFESLRYAAKGLRISYTNAKAIMSKRDGIYKGFQLKYIPKSGQGESPDT